MLCRLVLVRLAGCGQLAGIVANSKGEPLTWIGQAQTNHALMQCGMGGDEYRAHNKIGVPYSHSEPGSESRKYPLFMVKGIYTQPHITRLALKKGLLICHMKGYYSERPPLNPYPKQFLKNNIRNDFVC